MIIYSIYYFGVPAVINLDAQKSNIQKIVKDKSGIEIDYKNPLLKMGLTPSVILSADEFSAAQNLIAKDVKIQINLLPLIFKTLDIKKFTCENIKTNLLLDENGNLFIGNYQLKPIKQKFNTKLSNIRLYDYNINFDDKLNKKQISLDGKHFEIKENESFYLSTLGNIKINNKISLINLDLKNHNKNDFNNITIQGRLTDLDLSELAPYLSKLSNNLVENLSGIINIQAESNKNDIYATVSSTNFSLKLKDVEKPFSFKNKALIKTNLNVSNNTLSIEQLNVKSKDLNADFWGKIENITSKMPNYDLNLKLTDTKSENILGMIPYMTFPTVDLNLKKMRDYGLYGLINGQINIKGNDDKPDLTGSFIATNVYVQRPLNIPKATIRLDFKDKKCYFDAFAPASKTQNVTVVGNVELYNERIAEIDIQSTPAVDLKIAQLILNPLHEILNFEIGPVPIMDIKGVGNIDLKVKGNKQYPHLFGAFRFKNGTVSFNDVNAVIKNASGKLLFQDENMYFVSNYATLNNTPIKVEGNCSTQGVLNFDVTSKGQSLNEAIKILNTSPMLAYMNKFTKYIQAASGKINLAVNLKGQMKHIEEFELGKNVIASGEVKLLNNNVMVGNSIFLLKNISGNIGFNNDDVNFNFSPLIGGQRIQLAGKIKNNKIYSKNKIHNIKFYVKDSEIFVKSGEISLDGDRIILNGIESEIDSKPTIISGDIRNIFDNPKLDIFLSSSPAQEFMDKYINKQMIYPIILKGQMSYYARINGTLDALRINGTINMEKGSSIYHKGAIIDATENPLKLNFDLILSNSMLKVKNFRYNKLDENFKSIPLLSANGNIKFIGQNRSFDNFSIKTYNPSDARIFNIIFKKPIIKEGKFTSNLTLNGDMYSPKAFGTFNIFGVNAPFLDTTVKDINIVFKHETADISMKGEILSNEISLKANIKNSLNPPYVVNSADLYLGNFNINTFLKHLNRLSIEDVDKKSESDSNTNFDIRDLVIKELNIKAKSVYVRNLFATNFDAVISLVNGVFNLEKLNFVTAEGIINGQMVYNFMNSNMSLSLLLDKINANTIFEALFDVHDQFYGDLSGEANLSCVGKSHGDCMKTLSGDCKFSVLDGRMPKLGSLEYLLKSSNTFKSGITGLTINNIIELLTPLKTGDFESIKGRFAIKDGVTKDINIASKGKDLSIFVSGSYDFSTSDTSMEVYGRLAKKISTGLGVIGNISINTLFNTIPGVNLSKTNQAEFVQLVNKIPGIELNTNEFRIFFAKIDGNANTEDYHTIFKWID